MNLKSLLRDGNTNNKTVAVLSDTHLGSLFGLAPRSFVSAEHWHSGLTWLAARFDEYVQATPKKIDVLILNGDILDGKQRAQWGLEAWSTDPKMQRLAAVEVLQPLLQKSDKIVVIRGTDYHEGPIGEQIEILADDIGAEVKGSKSSHWHAKLKINGLRISVQHGISFAPMNRETPLGTEMRMSALTMDRPDRPDVVIRSHTHYFVHIEHSALHGFVTPGFQLMTAYMQKTSQYKGWPDVGGIWFEVTEDGELVWDAARHKLVWKVPTEGWWEM